MSYADPEHDKYTFVTGCIIIIFGLLGLFLNSNTLAFFLKYNHRGEPAKKRFKTVLVNMSIVDILLSLTGATIRGPGFIWPSVVYGDATTPATGTTRCRLLSVISAWLLSDLNMLAIIPISCICVFNLSGKKLKGIIAVLWILPVVEAIFLIVGIEEHYLDSNYNDTYRRCSIENAEGNTFNWVHLVDYFNMGVFNIMPLLLHGGIWISLCCKEPEMSRRKRLSGALVVVTALITWLPYGIVYGFLRYPPIGPKALVYIFFYLSIVTNPLIYGFLIYKCDIFREGCSECCFDREDPEAEGQPKLPEPVVDPRSIDIESSETMMTRPQWQNSVQPLTTSS